MSNKIEILTIILAYNEEQNIRRAIHSAKKISKLVYVVDSYSSDETVKISKSNSKKQKGIG